MRAETLRDPSFQIKLPALAEPAGTRNTTLILDREGRWCDIPCAHDTASLLTLVARYFKPRINGEIQRLKQLQTIMVGSHGTHKDIVLGVGLFYYTPPDFGLFEEEEWKGQLLDSMREAGLDPERIPSPLRPSLVLSRSDFLDFDVDPSDYNEISDLLTKTAVLCPALYRYDHDHFTEESLAIGYQAAIGIDGAALLGLVPQDSIQTPGIEPDDAYVPVVAIHCGLKRILR
jgi:hypothetical protein